MEVWIGSWTTEISEVGKTVYNWITGVCRQELSAGQLVDMTTDGIETTAFVYFLLCRFTFNDCDRVHVKWFPWQLS